MASLSPQTSITKDGTFANEAKVSHGIEVQDASHDLAEAYAAKIDSSGYVLSEELEKRILRKCDYILLPLISITTILSFLDKVSNNYANNYGLTADIHLTGNQYSWTASIFYFAFLVAQPGSSWICQKLPLGKYIGFITMGWGVILIGEGFCTDFKSFAALRFIQGLFEGGLLPAVLLMSSMFWTRAEQSTRSAFWFSSVAGILGGLIAFGIGHIHGNLQLWKYIYIIYGPITAFWGLCMFFVLPDTPMTWFMFTEEEKLGAVARVKDNATGIASSQWKWDQVTETLLDPKTYIMFMITLLANIPNGGLNAFSAIVIKGFGFSSLATTLLSIPFGVVATGGNLIAGLIIGFASRRGWNARCWVMLGSLVLPFIGTVILTTLPHSHKGASLMAYYFLGAFNVVYVMMLALLSSNTAGYTKKILTSALIWVAYCAGNIAGPFFFKTAQAPVYKLGIGANLFCFAANGVLCVILRFYLAWENKKRDAADDRAEDISAVHNFLDLTDRQNKSFRYTY